MKKYDIISFDMFQTLVDVNERIPQIWQGILGDQYCEEKAQKGAELILGNFPKVYEQSLKEGFQSMEKVYINCVKLVQSEIDSALLPHQMVHHILIQHGEAPFYEEVSEVIEQLRGEYKVILCSDSNPLMVKPILEKIAFDEVYISEELEAYKGEEKGTFFRRVLAEMNVEADRILHIGDSTSDVVGSQAVGIDCCWLNRENRVWKHNVNPTYQIKSLRELGKLLK